MTEQAVEKTKRRMPLWAKILCVVLAVLIGLVALVLLGARAYFRLSVWEYYQASEKGFEIPGLSDGFVPQGMDYDKQNDCFLITGYMNDDTASPIYLLNRSDKERVKTVLMATEEGEAFRGHAGGLALNGDYVYVAGGSDYCLYVYSYAEILAAEDGATVRCRGEISTGSKEDGIRVSCVGSDGERIWVAEFYDEPKYPTPESHKLTTSNGDYQQAYAVCYAFSEGNGSVFGVDPTPLMAYSLPDCVQGICFEGDSVYLSTSYGVSFSHIYEYALDKATYQKNIDLQKHSIPLYALDSAALTKDMKIAPMSEEIVFVDGRYYTMCESASNKYIFGKFTSAKWCYATDPEQMK